MYRKFRDIGGFKHSNSVIQLPQKYAKLLAKKQSKLDGNPNNYGESGMNEDGAEDEDQEENYIISTT